MAHYCRFFWWVYWEDVLQEVVSTQHFLVQHLRSFGDCQFNVWENDIGASKSRMRELGR